MFWLGASVSVVAVTRSITSGTWLLPSEDTVVPAIPIVSATSSVSCAVLVRVTSIEVAPMFPETMALLACLLRKSTDAGPEIDRIMFTRKPAAA